MAEKSKSDSKKQGHYEGSIGDFLAHTWVCFESIFYLERGFFEQKITEKMQTQNAYLAILAHIKTLITVK